MRSRNLFLKSNSPLRGRRWVLVLGAIGIATIVMFPRERNLDEWAWQSPVEPPGVTIVSHEPETLVQPMVKHAAPDLVRDESLSSSPAQSASTPTAQTNMTPAAMSASDHAQVRKALELWSLAWSARNVDAYLERYAKSFVPAGGQSRSAWEKMRRQRILSKSQISHEIRDLQITVEGDKATANFEQMYTTGQTRQVGAKTLRLQREGVNWLIISESSN